MSLSGLETALAEYVADVLVVDCGAPVPERVLRYHGPIPFDCCTDKGLLVVNWTQGYPSTRFPASAAGDSDPCTGRLAYRLTIRYVVCWPEPEVSQQGVTLLDDAWDAKAATLADIADCVARALKGLTCDPDAEDELVAAVLAQVPNVGMLRLYDVAPIVPQGGCAGVAWSLYASPVPGSPS